MKKNDIPFKSFKDAKEILDTSGVLRNTSLVYSDYFSNLMDSSIYLKPENFQRTGSFKMRGAVFAMSILSDEEKSRGVIAASAGNHAQSLALAAKFNKVKCTIVMPETAPKIKIENTKNYGEDFVNVITHGQNYDDAYEEAKRIGGKEGFTYVHAYDNLAVATGQGTISFEIFEELKDVDIIIVPIGGGGLAAGISTCAKFLNPNVKIIGVEPVGAACFTYAIQKGKPERLDKVNTIADGAQIGKVGERVFDLLKENLEKDVILIEDSDLIDSFLEFIEHQKMIVEPAGLLSIAALKKLPKELTKGKKIVSVISGGNIDPSMVSLYIQHGLRAAERIFTFSVSLPNHPGTLGKVSDIIAKGSANILEVRHDHFVNVDKNEAAEVIITVEVANKNMKEELVSELRKEYSITLK